MSKRLALAAIAGAALLVSPSLTPAASAGCCLLCIWQAAEKDPVFTIHLIFGIWITLLYPAAIALWTPTSAGASLLQQMARDQIARWGVSPGTVAPGYCRLSFRSGPDSRVPEASP